ncbi:hypothetical protein BN871_GK_00010 [Paenibacillus sp. P22]|nr:hypothetical protein BN871_GK_00010 [Paenibacillus sp. P22]
MNTINHSTTIGKNIDIAFGACPGLREPGSGQDGLCMWTWLRALPRRQRPSLPGRFS